jgi:hypothetical protein
MLRPLPSKSFPFHRSSLCQSKLSSLNYWQHHKNNSQINNINYFNIPFHRGNLSKRCFDLNSGGTRFESRPRYRLSWVRFYVIFFRSSRKIPKSSSQCWYKLLGPGGQEGGPTVLHMFLYFSVVSDVIRCDLSCWWHLRPAAILRTMLCVVSLFFPLPVRPCWGGPKIVFHGAPNPLSAALPLVRSQALPSHPLQFATHCHAVVRRYIVGCCQHR